MRMFPRPGMERFLQRPLARDVVRYSGEPVAVVVADSRYLAEDAAERIEVAYEALTPILDGPAAADGAGPVLHPEADSNIAARFTVEHGDVEAAFAQADEVVEATIRCGRHAAVPMETRGLVAELDAATGELTVWGAAKIPHINRRILAGMLGWPRGAHPPDRARRRRRLRRARRVLPRGLPDPVVRDRASGGRWAGPRTARSTCARRTTRASRRTTIALALARRRHASWPCATSSSTTPARTCARTRTVVPGMTAGLLPGPYRWGAYRCAVSHVVTNKTPAGTYRAPGRYEATLARERIVDLAARPAAARPRRPAPAQPRRRRRHALPHRDAHRRAPGGLRQRRLPAAHGPRPRALRPRAHARVARRRPGPRPRPRDRHRVLRREERHRPLGVRAGRRCRRPAGPSCAAAPPRSGRACRPCSRRCAPTHLGVGYDDVTVELGDTAHVPDGMGSFGSRATALAGTAVSRAADRRCASGSSRRPASTSRPRQATSRSRATASSCAARRAPRSR